MARYFSLPSFVTGDSETRPALLDVRSSRWFIILTVSFSVFSDMFLYAVIVPVIPFSLEQRVGIAPKDSELCASLRLTDAAQYWISVLLAVYAAALLAASPVVGWMSDRVSSRRLPFLFGLVTLALATVFLAIGKTVALFVVGRILQGISASLVWVVGLSVVADTVGNDEVGQAMGYVSIAMSLGILIAPLLGGVVFDKAGYYPVFAMCFGLLGVDIVLRLFMIERKVAKKWMPELDSRRPSVALDNQEAKTDGEAPLDANISAPRTEKDVISPRVPIETGESTQPDENPSQSSPHPRRASPCARLPPVITLLSSRRILAGLWAGLVQATLLTAFDSTLPLRVRDLWGWSSLGAGLIFLPLVIPSFISPLAGALADKYGARWLCTCGFLFSCPILVLLRYVDHDSLGQKVLLCAMLALLSLALSLSFAPVMAEVTYSVEAKVKANPGAYGRHGAYAQAYALFNMAFAAGCVVGPLWGGLVKDAAGWATSMWTLGLLSGLTTIPTVLLVGGWIGRRRNGGTAPQQSTSSVDA